MRCRLNSPRKRNTPNRTIKVTLVSIVLLAAAFDIRYRRMPNWLNLSGIALGFGLNVLSFHLQGVVSAGEGMLFAMAVYLLLYLLRGMGLET